MKKLLILCSLFSLSLFGKDNNVVNIQDPLDVVQLIGDKLIRETPFKYKLELNNCEKEFNKMYFVNFGRTFTTEKPAVAYAYTLLEASKDLKMDIDLEHNDACKIWLNNELIYEKKGMRNIHLVYEERSIEMSFKAKLNLKKGVNSLLIKSETSGGKEWCILMQPPATKGAVLAKEIDYPKFVLEKTDNVDSKIATLTNWLVIGPFERNIDIVNTPEKIIEFGKMYPGLNNQPVTWTIPKVEIVGNVIDPKPWGTTYQWNYHNGGVAWAMQQLSEASGNSKYNKWATNFCDYHLKGKSFVEYQVQTLNEVESANHYFIKVPLLDFTLAPALPFIYKLRKEKDFPMEQEYSKFVDEMIKYARTEQLRYPGSNIYTRTTPQKYTTWVDDMFMGIPFLVQASKFSKTKEDKEFFINDAALMVLNFNKFVWDQNANLYMHANYSLEKNTKLPHWSRANGWGIWATTEVLMNLDKNNKYYQPILEHYRKHVESLIKYQTTNGAWRNVLDRVDSPEEVSGTAIFTMTIARGITYGWLDAKKYEPIVIKGWNAVKSNIEPNGKVHNICVGTMCSEDENYYVNRPFYDDDTHGLFAVLFAGIDVHNMMTRNLTTQKIEKQK
jgi:rhamnogalacturonyl hydrolase YesR